MSAPRRFFVDKAAEEVVLSGDEFHHAEHALRLKEGDEVTLLDGSGKEYTAIVSKVERGRMILHVVGEQPSNAEPMSEITLLVGLLKGDKTELVVQKAAELGASRVGVFSSRYGAAYMNENKLGRLKRVAQEAAKQCRRAKAPEICYFSTLEEALKWGQDAECKLFACEFLKGNGAPVSEIKAPATLVVGSEGGFSEEEFVLAEELGYKGVSLGKRILRAETAAVSLLAVAAYFLGELR